MKFGKVVSVVPGMIGNFEDQVVEAVSVVCKEVVGLQPERGFRRNMESLQISCQYTGESDMLCVRGTIEHVPCGLSKQDIIDGMAEALMDWDKERGRGGDR